MAAPSYVGQGGAVAVTTAAAPAYPVVQQYDKLLLFVSTDGTIGSPPATGWNALFATTTAAGINVRVWEKDALGTETGTQSVPVTGGTKGVSYIAAYRAATTNHLLSASAVTGSDSDTSTTSYATTGASLASVVDDRIAALIAAITPSGTYNTNFTAPSLTQTSATLSTSARFSGRTGTNTIWYSVIDGAVTAGTGTTPIYTATAATADGATAGGVTAFVRLRDAGLANVGPTANAGSDQSVGINTAGVSLDGSGSTDSDGTIVSYAWSQLSGTSVTLSGSGSGRTFTAPAVPGILTFQLLVTDDDGATSTDTVSITVTSTAPSYRASFGAQGTSAITSHTVVVPGSVQTGDWGIIVASAGGGSGAPTAPAGWSTLLSDRVLGTGGARWSIFGRKRQAGDTDPIVTWASAPATGNNTAVLALWYSNTTGVTIGTDSHSATADVAWIAPSYTTSITDTTVLALSTNKGGSTGFPSSVTWGPDVVTRTSTLAAGNFAASISAAEYVKAAAGATGDQTATWNFLTANAGAVQLILRSTANIPPTANAGPDQTGIAPSSGGNTINGGASVDTDGFIVAWNWTQTGGTTTPLTGDPSSPIRTFTAPSTPGVLTFSLTVTDDSGATSTADTMTVTVAAPPSLSPTANAGADQSDIEPGETVTLNGSASADPDGTIASYSWTQVSGTPTVTLTGTGAIRTFSAPGTDAGTTLVFGLIVTDNDGLTSTQDTVSIGVRQTTEFRRSGGTIIPVRPYRRSGGVWV